MESFTLQNIDTKPERLTRARSGEPAINRLPGNVTQIQDTGKTQAATVRESTTTKRQQLWAVFC